jgi:hypothetical protein
MPRISEEFLDCVVYLYRDEQRAFAGEAAGGTGFIFGIPLEGFPNAASMFVVTNKHIIERGRAVRLNTVGGDIDVVEIDASNWITHPEGDDHAIAGLGLDEGDLAEGGPCLSRTASAVSDSALEETGFELAVPL